MTTGATVPAPSLPLRVLTLAAGTVGVLGLGTCRLLPAAAAAALLACLLGLTVAGPWRPGGLRPVGLGAAALLGLTALALAGRCLTAVRTHEAPGVALAPVVAVVLVAHAARLRTHRDVLLHAAIVGAALVLAAGLGPGRGTAVPVALGIPAVLAVLAAAHREHEYAAGGGAVVIDRRDSGQRPAPPGSWPATRQAVVPVVALSCALGLLAFLVLPRLPSVQPPGGTGSGSSGRNGDAAGRSAVGYTQTPRLDLDARGHLDDTPVVDVSGRGSHWRSQVFQAYDGSGWRAAEPTRGYASAADGYAVPAGEGDPAGPRDVRQDDVHVLQPGAAPVLFPGRPVAVRANAPVATAAGLGLWLDWRRGTAGGSDERYTVSYVRSDAVSVPTGQITSDNVSEVWTQLPPTVPSRVGALARRITAGATSRQQAVRAVEDWLGSHATYDLDSPVPAAGHDAVDDFLFVSHEGFCEQFASAAAVLLRSAGIPTRVVGGFASGVAGTGELAGRRVLRDADAHAWIEVWYPGAGWVTADPTPGDGSATAAVPGPSPLDRLRSGATHHWLRWSLLALAVVVLTAVVTVLRRRRRRRGPRSTGRTTAPPAAGDALLDAFARLEGALAAAGRPRAPHESVRELRWRLPPGAALDGAFDAVERLAYAPPAAAPTAAQIDAAVGALDACAARLRHPRPVA